ncbi:MAG: DUF4238 domain-containing protein [Clostridiales bacterium]|jgi:hypothetical protein|nr:DUF4238 domain-containing protein [Clostridiales bacterium]
MPQKKNQHYVPQFHIRNWSNNKKTVSQWNKASSRFFDDIANVKNIASKSYMYGKDGEIEDLFTKVENIIAAVYSRLLNDEHFNNITSLEFEGLYLYFSLCNVRTLESAESKERQLLELMKVQLKMQQAHGQKLEIPKDIFDKVKIDNAVNSPILAAIQKYTVLLDLDFVLIKNTSEVEFITSDYPLIHYNLLTVKKGLWSGYDMASAGAMFILPISPRYAILLYDSIAYSISNLQNSLVKIKQKGQIDEINKLKKTISVEL